MNSSGQSESVRRLQPGTWYWVEKEVIQIFSSRVGFLSMCVYHLLASMTDETQSCFPSQDYIAKRLGCSRASVSRGLRKLKEAGLIQITKEARKHPVYHLLQVSKNAGATEVSHQRKKDISPMHTNNTLLSKDNNNLVNAPTAHLTDAKKLLAAEIAETVGEKDAKKFFPYVKQYEESFLRQVLSQVRRLKKIKKSKTAFFIYLLNHYAK